MKKNKVIVTISLAFIFIGIGILSSNYIQKKIDLVYGNYNVDLYEKETIEPVESEIVSKTIEKKEQNDYLGILKINKIELNRGFYDKNSDQNNVNKNIMMIAESDYPDTKNGNVILAAHSGSSYIGFFKNLYKLEKGDVAQLTYKGKEYNYRIVNIYTELKDGDVAIYRDLNKKTLTLITCTKDDDTKQTIYILEGY